MKLYVQHTKQQNNQTYYIPNKPYRRFLACIGRIWEYSPETHKQWIEYFSVIYSYFDFIFYKNDTKYIAYGSKTNKTWLHLHFIYTKVKWATPFVVFAY